MVAQSFGRAFKLEMQVPVSELRKVGVQGGSAARLARRLVARRLGLATAIVLLTTIGSSQGANDTRTLTLHHIHTGEDITITYKRNGQFDEAALKRLNMFVRDWRKNEEVTMAPELYDMMWEVKEAVGFKGAIHIVCGYRSPGTNEMLRSRSGGVAKTSLHMQGKAMDFSMPGADVAQVRAAALRIQGGGVGYYPTSGIPFVHMDVGNVRHWPRMTRDQLVKVFPNGRTLHVPTDGNPLPGYELAMADHERGAHGTNRAPVPRNLLASLFSAQPEEEESSDAKSTPSRTAAPSRRGAFQVASAETKPAEASAPSPAQAAAPATVNVPLPLARPAIPAAAAPTQQTFQMASAESKSVPAPAPRAKTVADIPAVSIASAETDIFTARGYWQGLPEAAPATAEQTAAAVSAARRMAAAKLPEAKPAEAIDTTATVGPFARTDRASTELALSYAPPVDPVAPRQAPAAPRTAAVSTPSAPSLVAIPASTQTFLPVSAEDRLNDPWIRGVVLAPSVQNSMTTTLFGAPDFRALRPFIQKPATAVMMTFSNNPHLGMTTERFTGSAVAFQPTVTFGLRTAQLR